MMKNALFGGVNAAVLTPMHADLSVDLDRMAKHCRWLLANGCNGIRERRLCLDIPGA